MAVTFKLTDFEGPLDLLLHLVRETKMDIKTVALASITGQFLVYMEQVDTLPTDAAVEFIEIAAILIEIKARGILPKEKQEEDPDDIESKLKQQLEEYRLLKEAGEKLKEKENVDRFYKIPVELPPTFVYKLDNLSLDALTAAFQRILHKLKSAASAIVPRQIRLDRFTVKDKMADIRTRIGKSEEVMFFDLFDSDFTKSEMINTFLALLELLKNGEILALQESAFSDIIIKKGGRDDGISAEN